MESSLLREAIDAFERGDAKLEERAPSLTSAPCFGGAIDAPKRESCSARHSTPPTARAPGRSPNTPRPSSAPPARARAGSFSRGLDSLTASERRIAELASQGLTNREIAQTLFVTARTVEGHLTSVFRKLQVDSRDELPAALPPAAVQSRPSPDLASHRPGDVCERAVDPIPPAEELFSCLVDDRHGSSEEIRDRVTRPSALRSVASTVGVKQVASDFAAVRTRKALRRGTLAEFQKRLGEHSRVGRDGTPAVGLSGEALIRLSERPLT